MRVPASDEQYRGENSRAQHRKLYVLGVVGLNFLQVI